MLKKRNSRSTKAGLIAAVIRSSGITFAFFRSASGSSSNHSTQFLQHSCACNLASRSRYLVSRFNQKLAVEPSTRSSRKAVSSVIGALPLTSWFRCLRLNPRRWANSTWLQSRSAIKSRIVSPGGDTQSGLKTCPRSVMIVSDSNNGYRRNSRPIYAAIFFFRSWILVRLKYKPFAAS